MSERENDPSPSRRWFKVEYEFDEQPVNVKTRGGLVPHGAADIEKFMRGSTRAEVASKYAAELLENRISSVRLLITVDDGDVSEDFHATFAIQITDTADRVIECLKRMP